MSTDEKMPLSALPYFLKISATFCHAITESIELYKTDQDQKVFSKVLDHLSSDLDYYLQVYQTWQQEPSASDHQVDLATLGKQLHQAQKLLSSGVELIRH